MKQINLFFAAQVLRTKSGVYIFKVPQGDDEWNINGGKTLRERMLETISSFVKYIILIIYLQKICNK